MRAELVHFDAALVERTQQCRHGAVELGNVELEAAVLGARVEHAVDCTQRVEVDPACVRSRKRDHMFGAPRADELARRAKRDHFSVIHDRDAVAEAFGLIHIVGGEDDRASGGAELLDEIPELAARLRVETGRRLIEEEKLGVADEGARERETLLLSARESADAGVLLFLELHEGNHVAHFTAFVEERAEQPNGFFDGELLRELRFLELNAEAFAEVAGVLGPAATEDGDVTAVGGGESLADLDGGGFAGAVGSQEAEALAGAHVEVEAIDGDDIGVRLTECAERERHGEAGARGGEI